MALAIMGSTRTLYLQRRSPASNFLGEKGLPVLFAVASYLKNPRKGRRLRAHCYEDTVCPGWGVTAIGARGHLALVWNRA